MNSFSSSADSSHNQSKTSPDRGKVKKWYALYTRSRFEKRTLGLLLEQGIEAYLPLMRSWRVWSDRRKQIEVPLFSSYIFVYTQPEEYYEYLKILNTPGVVSFVGFEGRPVAVPERQIEALKRLSVEGIGMTPMDEMPEPGSQVIIRSGVLKGLQGEVLHTAKGQQLIIRIDVLDKCVTVNVPVHTVDLAGLSETCGRAEPNKLSL